MCPVCYWEIIREMSDPFKYRLRMVECASEFGISEAARVFQTTRRTVRKWLRRYESEGQGGLRDRSRAPRRSPHRVEGEVVNRILSYRAKRSAKGPLGIQMDLDLPHSTRTIWRILKQG